MNYIQIYSIQFNSIKLNSTIGLKFTWFELKDENTISFSKIVSCNEYNLSIFIFILAMYRHYIVNYFCLF